MAKRLSAQTHIQRLKAEGWSNTAIGKAIGRSPSTVGRIARGQSSGEKALSALRDFAKAGKRAKSEIVAGKREIPHKLPPAPRPKPKPAPAPAPPVVPPLDRAAGQLAMLDRAGVDRVMVHLTSGKTGRSRTLFAKGGVDVDRLRADLRGELSAQASKQGNNSSVSNWDIDWDDVEIEFEEF